MPRFKKNAKILKKCQDFKKMPRFKKNAKIFKKCQDF